MRNATTEESNEYYQKALEYHVRMFLINLGKKLATDKSVDIDQAIYDFVIKHVDKGAFEKKEMFAAFEEVSGKRDYMKALKNAFDKCACKGSNIHEYESQEAILENAIRSAVARDSFDENALKTFLHEKEDIIKNNPETCVGIVVAEVLNSGMDEQTVRHAFTELFSNNTNVMIAMNQIIVKYGTEELQQSPDDYVSTREEYLKFMNNEKEVDELIKLESTGEDFDVNSACTPAPADYVQSNFVRIIIKFSEGEDEIFEHVTTINQIGRRYYGDEWSNIIATTLKDKME